MIDRQKMLVTITRQEKGFTLVELMIVVAILAILAAIVIPIYNQYIEKSQRSNVSAVIEQFPVLLETYRAENGRMCPGCNANGTYTYRYIENNAGTPTTDTIHTTPVGGVATPFLPDFRPKSATQPVSPYDYQLVVTVPGCAGACVESAVVTAIAQTGRGAPPGDIVSAPIQ